MNGERKLQYKRLHKVSVREQKRQEVLKRQKEARADRLEGIRELVLRSLGADVGSTEPPQPEEEHDAQGYEGSDMEAGAPMEEEEEGEDGVEDQRRQQQRRGTGLKRRAPLSSARGRREATRYFTSQFSIPEWMVEVPQDLNGKGDFDQGRGWLVMPRPEGKRCLLVAHAGTTISRQQSGQVLHHFSSTLPHGSSSRAGRGGSSKQDSFSILDCVYHEPDKTYYVVDLLCWKGFQLQDCTTEFRLFFLRSKFDEEMIPAGIKEASPLNEYRIMPLLYYDADPAGIRLAYEGTVPFLRDGLLFLNKAGYYEQGLSPLILAWKDTRSSRYLLASSGDDGATGGWQAAILAVGAEPLPHGSYPLETLDQVCVGEVTAIDMSATPGGGLQPGDCVRCQILRATEEVQMTDGGGSAPVLVPAVEGLRIEKASHSRAVADPWSKILFRSRAARADAVTIEQVVETASTHVKDLPSQMEDDSAADAMLG